MVQQPTLTIPGASRTQYPFTLFPWGTAFQRFGAVYVVLRRQHDGRYQLLYVGQTTDMSERFLARGGSIAHQPRRQGRPLPRRSR